jgi:hypothetical protein
LARLCDALGSTDAREAGSMFYIFNLISVLSSHSNVSVLFSIALCYVYLFDTYNWCVGLDIVCFDKIFLACF